MSDGARMDDILGQALAKAEITSAGPIKIQPRLAPANVGQHNSTNHHNHHHHQSPVHHQKVVISRSHRNGPTHEIANFKGSQASSGQQNIIVVRNGQQVQSIQGQTILISSPSGSHIRQSRDDQIQSTPIRGQLRQANSIIRIDKSQLSGGGSVQFLKNGQIHTATATPSGHQLHQVQTTPSGGTRRILPQAQIANHTTTTNSNSNTTTTTNNPASNRQHHHNPSQQQPVHQQQRHHQNTTQQQQQQHPVNTVTRVAPQQPQPTAMNSAGNKTLRLVTVDRTTGRKSISGVHVAKIKLPSQSSGSPTIQQRYSSSPTSIRQSHTRLIQQPSPSPRPTVQAPARVSVQCHEPQGSKPGFIVLSSDSIDNLRNTYTQLQRCFATCIHDILDIDDKEHALMPKLKDIYRKSDTNYRNYLSKNPLKILDNVKAIQDGSYVSLEIYLKNESNPAAPSGNMIPYIRVSSPKVQSTTTGSGTGTGPPSGTIRGMLAKPATIARRPMKVEPSSANTISTISTNGATVDTLHTNGNRPHEQSTNDNETRIEPKIKVEKKPTPISLRIDTDHLNVTQMINIKDPFTSLEDIRERLMPFNCFSYPQIPERDDVQSEDVILEPLSMSIATRKRKLEQQFRHKFNTYNTELTAGEDVLISELLLEAERNALDEDRRENETRKAARIHEEQKRRERSNHVDTSKSYNNNHNYTVQPPDIDDESEHDNAVKGLLENF